VQDAYRTPGTFTRLGLGPEAEQFVLACRYQTDGWDYQFFFGRKKQPWKSGAVTSDAELICLSACAGAAEPDIILCNGSYLEIGGIRILSMKRAVARCELIQANARQVLCSDIEALLL
jgi:hypothetical protein